MNNRVFFDTNVLVYAFDHNEAEKGTIAKQQIHKHGTQGQLILSTQVLQEFYVTVTRKGKQFLSKAAAREIVNDFAEFPLVKIDKKIIARAMQRHESNAFSFWDSLIVEAALSANCTQLFSEDMQDGLVIGGLRLCNPFNPMDTEGTA